ncbi:Disease resistance protein RGA2, partial [Mucuna pruriens]
MSDIKAVVLDAEEKQGTNHQLQVWLDKLKDALDDADNLLDDFSTEDKIRQVMTKDKKAKKVRIFFSSSNMLLFTFKMTKRVKDIGKRLEALNVDRRCFQLTNRHLEQQVVRQRETHSFVRGEYVIGRENEKNYLLELLLNTNMNTKENVSIISIVGIGGLGKTALAQLLYNDKAVGVHFKLKMWVCVSDDFDVKTIAKKIIESKTNDEMDRVQQELRKKIEGNKYLLVLDDIWNEDRELWLQLLTLLRDGAKGSKIIITTRSERVAKISGTSSPFFLKGLDEEQTWKLFSQLAFEDGKEPENQKLVSIGKDIVKKCSGVPLAIRCVGSLMYSMETEHDWLNFKDKDLVKIDEEGGNRIFQILKLSYDHLPIHLKKCFAFCSLFPKDYVIDPEYLIRLWVAQGFVQSSNESICLEDVGNEYFMNLVHRSFFQDLERNLSGGIYSCKMHDLMHDMAISISRHDCVIVTKQGQQIEKRTHHLSFGFSVDFFGQVQSSLLKENKLRTILLPKQCYNESLNMSTNNLILSSLEQLRVLDLNHLNYRMLPSCIDMLKHLRYLNLSFNYQIEVLPRSITKLINLETLELTGCFNLRELPNDLWKMISLRHLELDCCNNLTFIPRGIGQLSNLQTLSLFILNKKFRHSGGPSELRGLNNLRQYLDIKGLECLRGNPSEAADMNLMEKSHLRRLSFTWDSQIVADENDMDKDSLILEGLHFHHNIKSLRIEGFGGVTLSGSIFPFRNLIRMEIDSCMRLQSLPPLHLIKRLELHNLPCLEWIDNNINNDNSSTSFPSLKEIILDKLYNLKGWCRCDEEGTRDCFHQLLSLDNVVIRSCPNIISFPPHKDIQFVLLTKILKIKEINGLKSLSRVLQHLTTVRNLSISNCMELDLSNDEDDCYGMQWKELTNLRTLKFRNIPKMESLPEGLQHISTLESLKIRNCSNIR